MLISRQHKFNSSLHYSPVVPTPPSKQNGDPLPWQQRVTLISFNDHWQSHAFDRYQIVSKVWLSNFSIFNSVRGSSHLPEEDEKKKQHQRKKNYHIATLLRQQSKVLGKCKIDEVGSTLRMIFVHLLYNLRVPCPATSNETLFPFSFHGRCRWYLRLCVQVFWGLICVGRGEVVACSLTEERKKKIWTMCWKRLRSELHRTSCFC